MRRKTIPYGRQSVDADDIRAVARVLKSDWLTTGPMVMRFERALAKKVGAKYAVAVNSGTAALHAAMFAAGIGPGDEVIVPPITFAASANCAVFQGAVPVFADVEPATLLLDPKQVARKITKRTRAIVAVDYAGHPCNYSALRAIAKKQGLLLVADACHALGAAYGKKPVGSLADLNCFSFHPVKHITTGEGGMITTDNAKLAQRMRDFRTHGITRDSSRFSQVSSFQFPVSHYYEMQSLGYNYRLSDINCALGLSQLGKLDRFVARRRAIAAEYDGAFRSLSPALCPLAVSASVRHAYHLYVVQVDFPRLARRGGIGKSRAEVVQALREFGVGTQVHYIPVHLHPFYRERFGYGPGLCPVAEAAYERVLSLPMFPAMKSGDVKRVIAAVRKVVGT